MPYASRFPVEYTDITQNDEPRGVFTFYPLPPDNTAVGMLRKDIGHTLTKDVRLGRGRKRVEYVDTEDLIMWDEDVPVGFEGMHMRHFGNTLRITFFDRGEAAKFKLLYCADGHFDVVFPRSLG